MFFRIFVLRIFPLTRTVPANSPSHSEGTPKELSNKPRIPRVRCSGASRWVIGMPLKTIAKSTELLEWARMDVSSKKTDFP
jgi:hypothetical protein